MMLKTGDIRTLILCGSLLLPVLACVKEEDLNEKYRPEGTEVVFSASTEYANGDGSRTEFSGIEVSGAPVSGVTPKFERIDWVTDDPMTIYYVNGSSTPTSAAYQVSSVAPAGSNDQESHASIEPSGNDRLTWGANANHVFCAIYPSAGYGGTAANLTRNGQGEFIASGSIPARQTVSQRTVNNVSKYLPDMKYGLMVAHKSISGSSTASSVTLPFRPAFTALEFKFKIAGNDESYKIRQLKIHAGSGYLSGAYSVRVSSSGDDTSWDNLSVPSGGSQITVDFDMDGDGYPEDIALGSVNEVSFTVLAVPSTLSQVTLQMVYANGSTKELPLKKSVNNSFVWEEFLPGRKYEITNYKVPVVDGGWSYMVEEIADYFCTGHDEVTGIAKDVRSYKYSALHPETKVDVPWKLQYSTDGTTWTDFNSSSGTIGSTNFQLTARTDKSLTFKINGTSTYTEETNTIRNQDKADMAARSPFTASGTYFDLSKHPCYGILGSSAPQETARTTANCYVVSRPGDYEFPCVYGNAITNGATDYASFAPGHTNSAVKSIESKVAQANIHWAKNFRNAANADITNPWIVPDVNATSLSAEVLQGSDIVTSATVADGSDGKYIRFSVASGNIKPSNVIIALKGILPGGSSAGILWSWHIWVTNKDLTPVSIGNRQMMDWNLGWMDSESVKRRTYADRSLQFRVVQTDAQGNVLAVGDSETFTVTQTGDVVNTGLNYGTNPYYQWGRKDPLASNAQVAVLTYRPLNIHTVSDSWDNYNKVCEGRVPGYTAGYGTDADYGYGIRHPLSAVSNSYTTGWVGGPVVPNNTWNAHYRYIDPATNNYTLYYDQTLNAWLIYEFNETEVSGQVSQLGNNLEYYQWIDWWYRWTGEPTYGPWTKQQVQDQFITPGTFNWSAFNAEVLADLTVKRKTVTSIAYNLWNAYCWCDSDFRSEEQVFKTVYDPCPPGFTVPSRGTFDNVGGVSTHKVGNSSDGILLSGHFFPFTGIRDWKATIDASTEDIDVYHWGHNPIELGYNLVGIAGYLWTAQHREIRLSPSGGNINRDNHYVDFEFARLMVYIPDSVTLPSTDGGFYTAGSAASVRPMVDPRYTAKVTQLDGDLEGIESDGNLPNN